MTLSPQETQEVLKLAAAAIVEEIRVTAGGDLASVIIFPLTAVSQMVGLSTKQIPVHLPITAIAPGKHGVTLKNIQDYVAQKTTQPRGRR